MSHFPLTLHNTEKGQLNFAISWNNTLFSWSIVNHCFVAHWIHPVCSSEEGRTPCPSQRTRSSFLWPLFHRILRLFCCLSDDLTHSCSLVCVCVCRHTQLSKCIVMFSTWVTYDKCQVLPVPTIVSIELKIKMKLETWHLLFPDFLFLYSVMGQVLRSFTWVKLTIIQCENLVYISMEVLYRKYTKVLKWMGVIMCLDHY